MSSERYDILILEEHDGVLWRVDFHPVGRGLQVFRSVEDRVHSVEEALAAAAACVLRDR